jgi:hypothetical protein
MKNLLVIVMLVCCFTSKSQTNQLNGALGLTFGCSKQAVQEMMSSKHADADVYKDDSNIIAYQKGNWAGFGVTLWVFAFTDENKLHTITILLDQDYEDNIFTTFKDVITSITNKYGKPVDTFENWKYPYDSNDKDSYGVSAIKLNKLYVMTYWRFPSNTPESKDDDNTLLVEITTSVKVRVRYQDGLLIDDVVEKQKSKNEGDM